MRKPVPGNEWKVTPLCEQPVTVFNAAEFEDVYLGCPSIVVLPSGRIIAAADQFGAGLKRLPGEKCRIQRLNRLFEGRLMVSSDRGATWSSRQTFPLCNARLFRDGGGLYLLGHSGNLKIMRSPDGGETWGRPVELSRGDDEGSRFVQGPGSPLFAGDNVYTAAMRITDLAYGDDFTSFLAPVILRARQGANLADRKSWTFSEPAPALRDVIAASDLKWLGFPFARLAERHAAPGQQAAGTRIGWDSPHLLQVRDAAHPWHDPAGRTFHMLARTDRCRNGMALMMKVAEDETGRMTVRPEASPAGTPVALLPLPGGGDRFHVVYDDVGKLYWLVSVQPVDSLPAAQRPGAHPAEQPQSTRLQLSFSRNMVDWCFAGFITGNRSPAVLHHSPVMAAAGTDLVMVCCTQRTDVRGLREPTELTFFTVPDFRELAY